MKKIKVAVFASGRGSNAKALHEYSLQSSSYEIGLIVSNRTNAGVLEYAVAHGLPSLSVNKSSLQDEASVLPILKMHDIDMIALAGFLLLIPAYLVAAYPNRILNIHPAILPHYGGHGMYGHHVHDAVAANKDSYSGATIHLVNEHYDEGSIIFQSRRRLTDTDDADDIARKVLVLEHYFYPRVLEGFAGKLS